MLFFDVLMEINFVHGLPIVSHSSYNVILGALFLKDSTSEDS